MRGRLAAPIPALVLLLAALTPGPAGADARRPAEREARERFQRAELAFNLGKFPDALVEYQAAYEAKPLPALLFNIAQCHRNMRNHEQARFFYRRYLALAPASPDRARVEDLITEMTRAIDREQSIVAPPLVPVAASPPVPAGEGRPVYQRWWFWTAVGVAVTGAVATAVILSRDAADQGTLPPIDGRLGP